MDDHAFCSRCGHKTELVIDRWQFRCTNTECGRMFYNNPTPVVAVVPYLSDQVLLAHNIKWPKSFLAPITGFIEMNESPLEAAIRECKEELGFELEEPALIDVYPFKRQNEIIIAYSGRVSAEVVLGDEIDYYEMLPFEKVRTWSFGTGLALKDFLIRAS